MLSVSFAALKTPLTFTEAMPIKHAMKAFRSMLDEIPRTPMM